MNLKKEKKKIRVARYVRVSTEEQAKEGYGIRSQTRILNNEIKKYENDGWYSDASLLYCDEGVSGASDERPAFKKLMQDVADGKVDLVLVWKIDRFFRRLELLLRYVKKLGEYTVQFKSSTEPFDTTAVGKLVFQMFGALAEFERELILQRTMEGKRTAAGLGNYVGGSIPFGYDIEDKKLVINKEEAPIIKKIFTYFVKQDMPILTIQKQINSLKIATKGDKRTENSKRSQERKEKKTHRKRNPIAYWSPQLIRNVLRNETYIGRYFYNRSSRITGEDGKKTKVLKPQEEWMEFKCEPIIDRKTFHEAQLRMQRNKQLSGGRKYDYLFSEKIWCGEKNCNGKFTGYLSKKRTKNYACKNKRNHHHQFNCPSHNISEPILDSLVWEHVAPFFKNPKAIIEKMAKNQRDTEEIKGIEERLETIKKELQQLSKGETVVKQLIREGAYDKEEAKLELDIVRNEAINLRNEEEALNSQLLSEDEKAMALHSIKAITKKYQKNFKNLSYKQKLDLYQMVVKKITIKGNDITIDVAFPGDENGKGRVVNLGNVYGGR